MNKRRYLPRTPIAILAVFLALTTAAAWGISWLTLDRNQTPELAAWYQTYVYPDGSRHMFGVVVNESGRLFDKLNVVAHLYNADDDWITSVDQPFPENEMLLQPGGHIYWWIDLPTQADSVASNKVKFDEGDPANPIRHIFEPGYQRSQTGVRRWMKNN